MLISAISNQFSTKCSLNSAKLEVRNNNQVNFTSLNPRSFRRTGYKLIEHAKSGKIEYGTLEQRLSRAIFSASEIRPERMTKEDTRLLGQLKTLYKTNRRDENALSWLATMATGLSYWKYR